MAQPNLQKKTVFRKAERMYAAGKIVDEPEPASAKRGAARVTGGEEYELSSYQFGAQTDKTKLCEPEAKLQTDCRANCRDGAEKMSKGAVAADPTCPHARHLAAKLRHEIPSTKEVIKLMRQAETYRRAGDLLEAVECLDKVLEADPLCAAAWTKRGDCVARLGIDGTRDEDGKLRGDKVESRQQVLYAVEHFETAQRLNLANLSSCQSRQSRPDPRQVNYTAQGFQCWNRLGHKLATGATVKGCTNFPQVGRIKPINTEVRDEVVSVKWNVFSK